jgi:hypothetical protein
VQVLLIDIFDEKQVVKLMEELVKGLGQTFHLENEIGCVVAHGYTSLSGSSTIVVGY